MQIDWSELSKEAWKTRENASIVGKTKVGAALITEEGKIFSGCNVEQRYRNHDVHAEVNAITNMITHGYYRFTAIIIVSERSNFTPCGSCLDWIFQFGINNCEIAVQSGVNGKLKTYKSHDLMPYYPF